MRKKNPVSIEKQRIVNNFEFFFLLIQCQSIVRWPGSDKSEEKKQPSKQSETTQTQDFLLFKNNQLYVYTN